MTYFKSVARAFLGRRGAPLILSAAEVDLVAAWEKSGLPLDVVLEGIERTFEKPGARRARAAGGRIGLAYCKPEVERARRRWLDRKTGGEKRAAPAGSRDGQAARAGAEAARFLAEQAGAPEILRDAARRAQAVLGRLPADEEALEHIDAEADEALLHLASEADLRAAGPGRAKLLRRLRERYGLPYFALFNY